uniref:Uncharacterized protein n=1 Tax=Candidatus Kentrum sp. FW TaxID=2126338 RepID=A0A450T7E4_9GAMM|nr:MAG: hypothetical protein BECKFW1821C_GA0114237_10034 [Candidatus Kentron sp. FW]
MPRIYYPPSLHGVGTVASRMFQHGPQIDLVETAIFHPLLIGAGFPPAQYEMPRRYREDMHRDRGILQVRSR